MKFKLWSILAFSFIMIACSSDVEDVNEKTGNATFEYDKIQVVAGESIASKSAWPDLKDRYIVDLRTCFVDTVYLQQIVGEDFVITSDMGEVTKTTDASGCLNWTETFDFNYLTDESYFKITGEIKGDGNFKGLKQYQLAINPWSGKVVDLNHGSAYNVRPVSDSMAINSFSNSLEAEVFEVELTEKKFFEEQTHVKLDITTEPQLVRKGLNGEILKKTLTGGDFKIVYHLMSKKLKNDERKIIATEEVESSVGKDGRLNTVVEFEIKDGLDPNSIRELGVEIRALGDDVNLGQDSGVMAIKDLDHRFSGKLIDINLDFAMIKNLQKSFDSTITTEDSFGFVMEKISAVKMEEGGSNLVSDNSNRIVQTQFQIKMVDSLIQQDIKNHKFRVTVTDMAKNVVLYSDEHETLLTSGDLIFNVAVPFRTIDRRDYKKYMVKVEGTRDPFKGLVKERVVYINPFLSNPIFSKDEKFGAPVKVSSDNIPEIFLEEFKYDFVDNKQAGFKLNRSLDLKLEKTMNLYIRPLIKVDHNYAGTQSGYEKLINGKYRLRFLILAPKVNADYTQEVKLDEFYTLTGAEKVVEVENGLIKTQLNLPMLFSEHIVWMMKNVALIQIEPVEVDAELKPAYFIGPMAGKRITDVVKSFSDSGVEFSKANSDIAQDLIKRINEMNYKLANDTSADANYNLFLKKLQNTKIHVDVLNQDTFKLDKRLIKTTVNNTESELKKRYKLSLSEKDIASMITLPSQMSEAAKDAICDILYDKNSKMKQYLYNYSGGYGGMGNPYTEYTETGYMYKKCKQDPWKFIDANRLYHVYDITKQPQGAAVSAANLSSNTAYFTSIGDYISEGMGERVTSFNQFSLGVNLGVDISKFGFSGGLTGGYSTGIRNDLYTYNQKHKTVSEQFRNMNGYGTNYDVDRYDLKFNAKVKVCLLVAGKTFQEEIPEKYHMPRLTKKKKKLFAQSSDKRIYVCMKELKNYVLSESWFFLSISNSLNTADDSLSRNSFVSVMRGTTNFDNFRSLQQSNDHVLIFVNQEDEKVVKQYKEYMDNKTRNIEFDNRLGIGFPGLLD